MSAAAGSSSSIDRRIKLLRYQPRAGRLGHPIGAIWQQGREVRWTSPIVREHEDTPDPKLFADWFPEAAYDFDHFATAVAWLRSACLHERELLGVAQACKVQEDLGLSCIRYAGPECGADLVALLDEGGRTRLPDVGMLRAILTLTLKHLVTEHPVLKGLSLEVIAGITSECARLVLPDGRLVRIYFDRDTRASHVIAQLHAESDRLFHRQKDSEISFFVFAQLRNALPLRFSTHALATGMRLPHIANGLVRLVWSIPLSS